jgi:hypothetical protein
MKSKRETLAAAPAYRRLSGATTATGAVAVDRKGGVYSEGLIRGASLVTKGEALGHGVWLDDEFVDSVVAGVNGFSEGVKSRFTHPGLSADGLATHLGRAMQSQRKGDQAVSEIHFTATSHRTPDGDLSSYVMDMAEESPHDVSISIVYGVDVDAEAAHFTAHGGKIIDDPYYGPYWDDSEFKSPDPANLQNLPHARLAEMRAADFVGDPAANPSGLFGREAQFAQEAEALAAFALGLSTERPQAVALGLDADRVQQFVNRFMAQHKLEITPMRTQNQPAQRAQDAEGTPAADPVTTPAAAADAPAATEEKPTESAPAAQQSAERTEARRFRESFGAAGLEMFAEGLSYEQAQARHAQQLSDKHAASEKELSDRLAAIETRLSAGNKVTGEPAPVGFAAGDGKTYRGFASKIRFAGQQPAAQ